MGPPAAKPVFADTNLGTHLAVAVSPDITVGDLKRKLGREHSTCFPNLGEIMVHALMVKRKLQHYHLPDSIPICKAFNGSSMTWFLFLDISPVEGIRRQAVATPHSCSKSQLKTRPLAGERSQRVTKNSNVEDVYDHSSGDMGMRNDFSSKSVRILDAIASLDSWEETKSKDNRIKGGNCASKDTHEWRKLTNISDFPESPSGSLPGKISITGIISSYFPDFDEVDSCTVNSAECKRVNNSKEYGESCMKISRSASNKVGSFEIGGVSLEHIGNSLEDGKKKKKKITKSKMAVTNTQTMCLYNGRADAHICQLANNVSRIHIDKHGEVLDNNSTNCLKEVGHVPHSLTKVTQGTPSLDFHVKTSRKLGRSEVGKRLLIAASKFDLSSGKKRSSVSKFIAQRRKDSVAVSTSPVRKNMFDISDGDD